MSDGEIPSIAFSESIRTETEIWLKGRLAAVYTQEGVGIFWDNPNELLDGLSPKAMLSVDPGRVAHLVDVLES